MYKFICIYIYIYLCAFTYIYMWAFLYGQSCAGGVCLIACAMLLLPAALFTAMAAVALLLSFTILSLLVRHGFQPHAAPRSSGPPGTFAGFCRHMVR